MSDGLTMLFSADDDGRIVKKSQDVAGSKPKSLILAIWRYLDNAIVQQVSRAGWRFLCCRDINQGDVSILGEGADGYYCSSFMCAC